MNSSMSNPKSWVEVIPDYINNEGDRSPANYIKATKQFEVATNPRYVKGHDGVEANGIETYCNIYLWDASKAMGVEIPHWIDEATGVEAPMGKGKELSANGICEWFRVHALKNGWMKCGEEQAKKRASLGLPTVVIWKNVRGIGHVAMVLPGTDFTHIAQAGSSNFFDGPLVRGFGGVNPLEFYTHD